MREIKFRAWDKVNGKMLEYGSDKACELWEDGCDLIGMSFISCQPNIIWMQYTGLKDKNGTEIYDGDLVQGRYRAYEMQNVKQKVTYLNGCFMFGNWNAHEYFNRHQEIEVIGNIYENPELLGDTK